MLACRATPVVLSPFSGSWDYSMPTICRCINIKQIEDQPVAKTTIYYPNHIETIEAGEGKYYGQAFFYYCWLKYALSKTPKDRFVIIPQMVAEAFLYYGAALWSDNRHSHSHPAIVPFQVAAQNINVEIELVLKLCLKVA